MKAGLNNKILSPPGPPVEMRKEDVWGLSHPGWTGLCCREKSSWSRSNR
jgi:hypothetical protein